MFKGEIQIQVRDAATLELQEERQQSNIVLNSMFALLTGSQNPTMPNRIVVTTKKWSPSRFANRVPAADNAWTSSAGSNIPGRASPEWFDKNGNTPAFIQWSTRIDVPSQNRQINTIMLTDISDPSNLSKASTNSGGSVGTAYAYAKLAQPCEQTTTQILDVYYRIYFPEENMTGLPVLNFPAIAQRWGGFWGNAGIYGETWASAFRFPKLKYNDQNEVMWHGRSLTYGQGAMLNDPAAITSVSYFKRRYASNWGLGFYTNMIADIGVLSVDNPASVQSQLTGIISLPSTPSKIQNLFGRKNLSPHVHLDVDNLPTGKGKVQPSGVWQNADAPAAPGLYYSGKWPSQFYVNITQTGAVGVAKYKIKRRPFFGQQVNVLGLGVASLNIYPVTPLSANRNAKFSFIGDMSKFGPRQLSSIVKYDDVSVVIPLQNSILLYNLANADYWRYKAAFTDITQLAVVGDKIYAGCRNTGLWMIDPKNSADAVSLAAPAAGIDLSACYGVAKGYANSLWAVGPNGIVHFDGTTWRLYNGNSSPAFQMTGISDGKWSNIEYIKANAATAAGELLLMRRLNADVDSGIPGVWWSLAGMASNCNTAVGAATSNGSFGRINRSHIECSEVTGQWVMAYNASKYTMTFGTTTLSSAYGSHGTSSYNSHFDSIMFAKNAAGQEKTLAINSVSNLINGNYRGLSTVQLFNSNGTVSAELTTANSALRLPNYPYETLPYSPDDSGFGGKYDYNVAVNMGNGVVFTMGFFDKQAGHTLGELWTNLFVYPFDRSMGGPLAHLAMTEYGWDGTKWVAGHVGEKTTHADAQPMFDGVNVSFADGTSGTSFVAGEAYNFAVCEGIFKDNATTNYVEVPFYFKKVYPEKTEVTANTVPLPRALSTVGQVVLDIARSTSLDMEQNAAGEFVFFGENGQQWAVGEQQLVGDFNIRWDVTAGNRDVLFGIGHAGVGNYSAYWSIDNTGAVALNYINQSNQWSTVTTRVSNGSVFGVAGTSVNSLGFKRVGNVLKFFVNDVEVGPNTSGTNLPGNLPAARHVYDVVGGPWDVWQPTRQVANRKCPKATIVENGTTNAVMVGSALDNSGAFNPKFYAIDHELRNGIVASIGGINAAVRTDYQAPNPGEISVDPWAGTFVFNAADEGKAFAVKYTYMTHE